MTSSPSLKPGWLTTLDSKSTNILWLRTTQIQQQNGRRGGGVGLKHIPRIDIEKKEPTIEHQWFEVKGKKSPFLLAVFYQPSSNDDKRIWLHKFEVLVSYVLTIWTDPVVITGDTNN